MKKSIKLYLVLFVIVLLVVFNIGLAGDNHVVVVKDNVNLKEENTNLSNENSKLTQKNKELNEKVEVLNNQVEIYEKQDSARNSRNVSSWELVVPIK